MLYGGVMITPAISVLSAVEGLQMAAPQYFSPVGQNRHLRRCSSL